MVTELCVGGELFNKIIKKGRFEEREVADYIFQILKGVAYCHSQGIVHRDLKPENIMFDKQQGNILKLIDFGTACTYDREKQKIRGIKGTSYYLAPEVVVQGEYDERCDIWSIGVIMYILLYGEPPFVGDTNQEIMANIRNGIY